MAGQWVFLLPGEQRGGKEDHSYSHIHMHIIHRRRSFICVSFIGEDSSYVYRTLEKIIQACIRHPLFICISEEKVTSYVEQWKIISHTCIILHFLFIISPLRLILFHFLIIFPNVSSSTPPKSAAQLREHKDFNIITMKHPRHGMPSCIASSPAVFA